MSSLAAWLTLLHMVGLALGMGAATVKFVLLLRCRRDLQYVAVFAAVSRPITRLIVIGLALLTLSGLAWLVRGLPLSWLLGVKIVLVAAIWLLGPYIDKVVEPHLLARVPKPGEPVPAGLAAAVRRYVTFEAVATLLFYAIVVIWVLA